ncbi:MAG TPA: GNAT family N-acetyltransferase [Thermoanaerobaculia bacterium]
MKIEIRRATPTDSERATEIAHKGKAHWGYPVEWMEAWRSELAITAEEIEKHPTFVASVEGEVVGVCQLREPDGRSVLEHVWVDPSVHGRGVGRALVEKARSIAQGLIVIIADPSAEPFYVKLGARRVGQVAAPMPGAPKRALPLLEMDA